MLKSRKIHALSFDMDNCLFHSGYVWKWNDRSPENQHQVIDKNKALLDTIKANKNAYDNELVLMGSQSWICHSKQNRH